MNEKVKMECLMGKCEAISQTIRDLFEEKSSTAEVTLLITIDFNA